MNHATKKTQDMVKLALFAGIIVVLSMTPLGYIPLGAIKATTIHIPVILGSILLGWKAGAALGGLFGLTQPDRQHPHPVAHLLHLQPLLFVGRGQRQPAGAWLSALCRASWWGLSPTFCSGD